MDLADAAQREELSRRLGAMYLGRPVLFTPSVKGRFTRPARWLRELRCRLLVVSTGRGAGDLPEAGTWQVVEITEPPAASVTEEMRGHDHLVRHLPPHAVEAVEAFDPGRDGLWYATPFVTTDQPVLGRPVTGGRPAAFVALEDKLLAERIWAACGVRAAPHRVVPVEQEALALATAEVTGPLGAVWSGDARDGFNGGGDFVRWVGDDQDAARALAFFAQRCDRVRVLPFLDGVPCSIHGIVLPDGTATFRPVEIAMLRDVAGRRFEYGGLATFWDPPAADREQMRDVARRVGDHLAATHGYRGAFGIDGVLTADGFRPTELNSRLSVGLTTAAGFDERLLALLQATLIAGRDPGVTVTELESLVPVMDEHRVGRPVAVAVGRKVGAAQSFPVSWDGRTLRREREDTGNRLELADTATGFFARIDPCSALRPGDRLAELTAGLLAFLDREYDTCFGSMTAAPSLR